MKSCTMIASLVVTAVLIMVPCMSLAGDYDEDFTKYTTDSGLPIPDFSEHARAQWANYCAPTAAANCVYYFGMSGHASLLQGNPIGPDINPGGPADTGATNIIAGVNSPPPAVGTLAQRMGTTLNGGTTPQNMANGLDAYLEANDPFAGANVSWTTTLKLNTDPGVTGQVLWDYMKDELYKCEDVLPLIQWPPEGPPIISDGAYSSIGHAVTMVGFDDRVNQPSESIYINDPANNKFLNPPFHNWAGEYAKYSVTITATTVDFVIAGTTASIYGVVSTSPVPEPATLALLALGGLAALKGRRRHA